jgi:VCBS repeat-containing protein
MKKNNLSRAVLIAVLVTIFAACKKNDETFLNNTDAVNSSQHAVVTEAMMAENGGNPDEAAVNNNNNEGASFANTENEASGGNKHFVYTESNAADGNKILAYKIKNNGSLELKWTSMSGGNGTGSPLGSQGALVLDENNDWLYAVNAASNSVSSFKVENNGGLTLAHTVNTGGTTPVSVTVKGNLLYVLNRGSNNIQGIRIGNNGSLTHINNANKPLSGTGVDAPQISFTPDGSFIVVTEKATNKIGTFRLNNNGSINTGHFTTSTGATPFGFEFARNNFMVVSNAAGGAAGAGSSTSYTIHANGIPNAVNGAVANQQAAPCWVAVTAYGRYAFVTNTASNNISSYYVAPWGGLYLIRSDAAQSDAGPLDIVVAENNYYVYALNGGAKTITGYTRGLFGALNANGRETGLPNGSSGLATF